MKVLHLIDSGGLYGAEQVILNLMREQIRAGNEPMLLSAGKIGEQEKAIEAEAKKRKLPCTPWRMKKSLDIQSTKELLAWAQSENYQILHSHGYKFNILLAICRLMGKYRLPTVSTVHGYTSAPTFSKSWVYKHLDQLSLCFKDKICLVSKHMIPQVIAARISPQKIAIVENGMENEPSVPSSVRPDGSLAPFLERNQFNMLAVGRLSAEKNFSGLIRALALLGEKHRKVGLTIFGEGPERTSLERVIVAHGLENRVLMPGFQNVVELMPHFDLLVIPSLSEGMPVCLLEAMRSGIPIAATPVGGIPGVLDGGGLGFLAQSASEEHIANMLNSALSDPQLLNKLSERALTEFHEKYTVEIMQSNYERVYQSLFSTKS